jgi:sugar lactone lactonase YvrE
MKAHAQREYRLFESDPVRPMALSPDGTQLYVVNTPDARLEVFADLARRASPTRPRCGWGSSPWP